MRDGYDPGRRIMKRRLLNFAAALSLILFLLTLALSARVRQIDDHLIFTIGHRFFHLASWSQRIGVVTTSPWLGHEKFLWITKPSPNEIQVGPIFFHHLVDSQPSYDRQFGITFGRASERTYVGPNNQSRWDHSGNNGYVPNDDRESHETELMTSRWCMVPLTHIQLAFAIMPLWWCVVQVRKRMPQRPPKLICKSCGAALEPGAERCANCGSLAAQPQ
jgi:ribosomal protein L40E